MEHLHPRGLCSYKSSDDSLSVLLWVNSTVYCSVEKAKCIKCVELLLLKTEATSHMCLLRFDSSVVCTMFQVLNTHRQLVATMLVSAHFLFSTNFHWTVMVQNMAPANCEWGRKLTYILYLLLYLLFFRAERLKQKMKKSLTYKGTEEQPRMEADDLQPLRI